MFDHISPFESFATPGDGEATTSSTSTLSTALTTSADRQVWDAYHMNSIDKSAEGNYLISVRSVHRPCRLTNDRAEYVLDTFTS